MAPMVRLGLMPGMVSGFLMSRVMLGSLLLAAHLGLTLVLGMLADMLGVDLRLLVVVGGLVMVMRRLSEMVSNLVMVPRLSRYSHLAFLSFPRGVCNSVRAASSHGKKLRGRFTSSPAVTVNRYTRPATQSVRIKRPSKGC